MTNPIPEAVALRAKMDAEGHLWPSGLLATVQTLLCELESVVRKGWRETGGPQRLAQYVDTATAGYKNWKLG